MFAAKECFRCRGLLIYVQLLTMIEAAVALAKH